MSVETHCQVGREVTHCRQKGQREKGQREQVEQGVHLGNHSYSDMTDVQV